MNIYRLKIIAKCPANGAADEYDCEIRSARMITVENIMAAVALTTAAPIYQEHLAAALYDQLHATVTLTGWHQRVFVEASAP